jgi:hypothetical protein
MTACIDIVRREIGDMTDKELDEVLEQMRGRQANLIRGGADPSTAAAQAGMEVAETLRAAAAIERRNALINRRVRIEALDYITTTWGDNLAEGVLSMIYGSSFAREGSRASVNAAQSANFRRYMGGVFGELEAAGLFDVLKRGELDRDVFVAMRSINDPAALRRIPEQAVAIAKILTKWQEVSRIEANRAGAWIGKVDDYGLRQTHNADRIMRAGEAKWKAEILPKLDLARMFPDGPPKDIDDWLHETFLNIVTGVRDASPNAGKMAAFKGPGNLAKKLSQERVLHFRSADDAFQYNIDYGMGNIRESFVTGMHQAAESTGLMQVLGTNPEYNLWAVVDAIRSRLSRSDPEALRKFDGGTGIFDTRTRVERAYREVSGQTRRAASARLAAVGQGIRVWNTLTGLGGAVVSAVTDVPIRASLLRYQGQSYLQQLGKGLLGPLTRLADSMDSADRKAVLSAAGYFNEVSMGNLASRFSPDDTIPGALNRATNTFFKWNLLAQWTDSMRRSTLEAMAHYWGGIADRSYAQLSDRNRMALTRFRIGEKEWGVISKGITEADGRKFMTPQSVREMDADAFRPLAADRIREAKAAAVKAGKPDQADAAIRKILDDTRAQMADRLQQFYADDLDSAVISPDARTQAFIRQGQQAGTPIGEALRMFWQFKSFGIAIMQRAFLRELRGYGPKASTSQAKGIALLMLGSLGFGYMAMTLKDLIKGKTPRPLDSPATWTAAMAQGGGMGIYGDFLFGESSRMGGGFLETLGGPSVGKLADAKRLFDAAKSGDDVGAQGLRFVVSNTPGNNLFYTRMAVDYLFLYELQEALSPGYLRRMERRAEEERGQEWWLRPSEAVN